jgi:hypothetical protein
MNKIFPVVNTTNIEQSIAITTQKNSNTFIS